jgi:hypothetical protein
MVRIHVPSKYFELTIFYELDYEIFRLMKNWIVVVWIDTTQSWQASYLQSGVRVMSIGVREENKPRRPSADIMYIY